MKLLQNKRYEFHPWSEQGVVCHMPLDWLLTISNPNPTDSTDLLDGRIVHQDIVWRDIEKNGMLEPLLMVVSGKHRTIRLESGNHRIRTAIGSGYTHIPCSLTVIKEKVLCLGNGEHSFDAAELVDWVRVDSVGCPYPFQLNPIEILNGLKEVCRSSTLPVANF